MVLEHFNKNDNLIIKKNDYINVKNLPYKEKKEFIRFLLTDNEGTLNSQVVLNISFLLKKNKTLTKELFEREDVFFNDYIELLDIKQDLRTELNALRKDIITIYYSIAKSISILNQEESAQICNLKYLLMHLFSLEDISIISQLVREDIKAEDIVIVDNAKSVMNQILKNSGYEEVGE